MENNNQVKNKIVQTYAEDMAHELEDGKDGIIKKIIHGEVEHEREKMNMSPNSKKNRILVSISSLLILVSLAVIFLFFVNRVVPSVPVEKQFVPLIYTDKNALIETATLTKDEIAAKVRDEINNAVVKQGGLEGIYLTLDKAPVGLRGFVESIDGSFSPGTDMSIVSDNFLLGFFQEPKVSSVPEAPNTGSKDFFILIKMRSIADIFTPMRDWENKIFFDLHGFFGIDFTPETKILLTKNFEDSIVENKNARVLYDEKRNPVIMYVFADNNSLIITNTNNAAREIILRLASSEVKK